MKWDYGRASDTYEGAAKCQDIIKGNIEFSKRKMKKK